MLRLKIKSLMMANLAVLTMAQPARLANLPQEYQPSLGK
jgi:hypothetical protein